MKALIFLLTSAALAIIIGLIIMYELESGAQNSKMKTILDALWWCVATVTTVGYGDIVPVTGLGRIVAMVYMFFGITLITTLLAVVTNTFYKKRVEKGETIKKEHEMNYLRGLLMDKLLEIERKQLECIQTVDKIRASVEKQKEI
jgi:voltage-gated potassium channel Kch